MALDFFAGCVGGAAAVVVAHPLDTVKVRIQTQCPVNPKYRGTYHCLSTIIKQESIAGLYKGIASPLYGVAGINALIFGVYGCLKPMVMGHPGNDSLWAHFAAGATAGAVQSVIASPMELIKTRMQLDESTKGKGPKAWDVMKSVYLKEGGLRRGIFKGWCVTLSREIPGLGAYFATYEALTSGGREISTPEMMMAGGTAGIASWVSCFPMDVIKTRIQSDTVGKYNGAIDCFRKTVAGEGYRALFRGLNSTLIRAFPANAATFTVVTWIMRLANQEGDVAKINNLEAMLEQWEGGRLLVQETIAQSLQLRIPQYNSFLPVAGSGFGSGSGSLSLLDAYNQFCQDHISQNSRSASSYTLAPAPASGSDSGSGTSAGSLVEIIPEQKLGEKVVGERIQNPNPAGNEINDAREIPSRASTPTIKSFLLTRGIGFRAELENNNAPIIITPATPVVEKEALNIRGTTTEDASASMSSSPIRGNVNSNANSNNMNNMNNSHETGSFPPDLGVLAEILDLPLIVLQNSLDGQPLTLFNIILTWLKEGTRLSLCKCLDALDHCVCYIH